MTLPPSPSQASLQVTGAQGGLWGRCQPHPGMRRCRNQRSSTWTARSQALLSKREDPGSGLPSKALHRGNRLRAEQGHVHWSRDLDWDFLGQSPHKCCAKTAQAWAVRRLAPH